MIQLEFRNWIKELFSISFLRRVRLVSLSLIHSRSVVYVPNQPMSSSPAAANHRHRAVSRQTVSRSLVAPPKHRGVTVSDSPAML